MEDTLERIQSVIISASTKARGSSIAFRRQRNPTRPAASWITTSRIGNSTGKALSVVFSTIGCSHARGESGGCTMCSYLLDGTSVPPSAAELVEQFAAAMSKLDDEEAPLSVKLYTSGSFLDSEEFPSEAMKSVLETIAQDPRITQVVVESRPDYVTESNVSLLRSILGYRHIEIGIGLESMNERVRMLCVNKGFSSDDFEQALLTAKQQNIGVRAYVLIKPPFMTERDAILDSVLTVRQSAALWASTVSVNPVNIQRHTLVEQLWTDGLYRPPWLWTVVEVLKRGHSEIPQETNLVCDPVAAGKARGAHNCGRCDQAVIRAIRDFSLDQDPKSLEGLDCECKTDWEHVLAHEDVSLYVHSDRHEGR
ncbi:MAG: archaeosine biosynthesis radical SAM protein RaSEA [Candidatus Thorarchaeota archaeon]|nr:MAG: archaeosine biosynthesis radical SAM protein RaSEA [Candidatus Thorarchaeota archaeon]